MSSVQQRFQLSRFPIMYSGDDAIIGYEYRMTSPTEDEMVVHNSAIDSDPLDLKKHDAIASKTYHFLLNDYAYKAKLKGYDVCMNKIQEESENTPTPEPSSPLK